MRGGIGRGLALIAALWAGPAAAQLLAEGQDSRDIALRLMDGKPFVAVQVDQRSGWMMLDNGTPDAVFLNRHALALAPGPEVGRGKAASGQEVVVWLHDAPALAVAGQPMVLPAKVPSGDFGFAEGAFGADFMGFLGSPAVEGHVFVLDYLRGVMTVFRPETAPAPRAADVLAEVHFAFWRGEQPTMAGLVGGRAMLIDLDTGDGGTIYLRPETRAALVASGAFAATPEGGVLKRLSLAGVEFADLPVEVVQAGGPADVRTTVEADFLRLGSGFLARQPVVWDFPGRRLLILRPEAVYPPPP